MKPYFDAVIVAPLEEEFLSALAHFKQLGDLSTGTQIRFRVGIDGCPLELLLVKQNGMGRTAASSAVAVALSDVSTNLVVCIGIAGALSNDLNIGDVCYSGTIIDILDNTKISTKGKGQSKTSLSPSYYSTPVELVIQLNLNRLVSELNIPYQAWQEDRFKYAQSVLPGEFLGKNGRNEVIEKPNAIEGSIACGAVSADKKYNERLKELDRKLLCIETESGGIFATAKDFGVPALAVRGISDYAGSDKNKFEIDTKGKARQIASHNTASFLVKQLSSSRFINWFTTRRSRTGEAEAQLPLVAEATADVLARALKVLHEQFDQKLRELVPGYTLQEHGYRLPVPRIRTLDLRSGVAEHVWSDPLDVREGLKDSRILTLTVPREYPDLSLSWIIATDLISAEFKGKQAVPVVIEASHLRRPGTGIQKLSDPEILKLHGRSEVHFVFIIDDFKFDSKTKIDFLTEQIKAFEHASFIVVTRDRVNLIAESHFTGETASSVTRLCDISFVEISHFLQKKFELTGPASEVIAARLRTTFKNFNLSAHPTYFSGIPKEILFSLLQANRRGELIQLAVVGYLSFVVARDDQPITLSRTTRELFLTELAFKINVEKATLNEQDLIVLAEVFKRKYDFSISTVKFIDSFVEKGIFHFDDGRVKFSLPFIESYVLAKRLFELPEVAKSYFATGSEDFDHPTFTLYAEMGPADDLVAGIIRALDEAIEALAQDKPNQHILLGNQITPMMIKHSDRIAAIQKRVQKAATDVRNDHDDSQEKQKLLDAADRIREHVTKKSKELPPLGKPARDPQDSRNRAAEAIQVCFIAASLLGAGAERLEGATKRQLISRVTTLTTLIIDAWTRAQIGVNFSDTKKELVNDADFIKALAKSENATDIEEAKKTTELLVDILEYVFLAEPTRRMLSILCEEARERVLAESIVHTSPSSEIEKLIHAMWLSDVDAGRGKRLLNEAIKALPNERFLRITIATHLITRVFWSHWKKEDRLTLLDAADTALRGLGQHYDKSKLKRLINSEGDDNEAPA